MNEKFIRLQSWRTTGLAAFLFGFICWGAGLDFWNAVLGSTLAAGIVGYGTAIGLAWYAVRQDSEGEKKKAPVADRSVAVFSLPTAAPIRAAQADAPMVAEANAGRFEVIARPRMSSQLLQRFDEGIKNGEIDPTAISRRSLEKPLGLNKDNAQLVEFVAQMRSMGWLRKNGKAWELVNRHPPHSQAPSPF